MSTFYSDYGKRDGSLPPGCKDLIDVLKRDRIKAELWATHGTSISDIVRKSGLSDRDAQDILDHIVARIVENNPTVRHDPNKGSFQGWLLQLTRWCVADKLRKKNEPAAQPQG